MECYKIQVPVLVNIDGSNAQKDVELFLFNSIGLRTNGLENYSCHVQLVLT